MANRSEVKFFNGVEVEKYLPLKTLIEEIEKSFVLFTEKDPGFNQPQRMVLPVDDDKAFLIKPVTSKSHQTNACKLLTQNQNNKKEFNLPVIQGALLIFDSVTGSLQAILDAIAISDLRTPAATAVAVKYLSKLTDQTLAIIGTGHQGISHIKLLREVKTFSEVRCFSRSKKKREQFAKKWGCIACLSVEEAVKDVDIIVTVTTSETPVLLHEWIKPGCLVCIVGAPFPHQRECDNKIMLESQVFADTMEGSYASAGDIIQSNAKIYGELGDVINGRLEVDWHKTRVFKSNGMAIQDLVAGKIVVDTASKN